ncbi:hypothetical protein LFYK43_19280 [Ligilactobacillus salitolerans]|uniref:Uncharacterized protein n=1 Tax=Ligilactobacillus salitolerans TaxID=1808352 RepID=A0A401IVB5_9LACO|nr:hypothetical protein LFYK43_19280 [Ligilactobacillus salitolerans]
MQKVAQEKQELIQKSAKEIDEFYKWNYIGVEKTTTGKLWRNPASGDLQLNYNVYLNSGKKQTLSAEWDSKKNIILVPFKNGEKNKPTIKVPESGQYIPHSSRFLLQPKDIQKLKKQGYSTNIDGKQIKLFLIKEHPQKFEH